MSLSLWDTGDLVNKTTLNEKIAEMKKAAFLAGSGLVDDAGVEIEIPASQVNGIPMQSHLSGVYVGDGSAERIINLGFTPSAVELYKNDGEQFTTTSRSGGLAIAGHGCVHTQRNFFIPIFSINEDGFTVFYTPMDTFTISANSEHFIYYYIAFK